MLSMTKYKMLGSLADQCLITKLSVSELTVPECVPNIEQKYHRICSLQVGKAREILDLFYRLLPIMVR